MRSPSGTAVGSWRGVAPVATSTVDAAIEYSSPPPAGVTITRWVWPSVSSPSRAVPATNSTPALTSLVWMSADCARASRLTRSCTARASTVTASRPSECTPNSSVSR